MSYIRYAIVINILVFVYLFIGPMNLAANGFEGYKYSNIKQAGGITYEVTASKLSEHGLTLEGWAYIADSQHYQTDSDLDLYFMTHVIDGSDKKFYRANVDGRYDLTDIEEYQGSRMCGDEEYQKDAIECNYIYKNVGFSVNIPLDDIKYPNRYSLFLYAHAKKSGERYYTQVYAPGLNAKYKSQNITYEFDSALDEAEMVVNNEQIIARTGPGKKYSKLVIDAYERYFKNGVVLRPNDKSNDGRITWYKVPVSPDDTIVNNHKLVAGSNGYNEKMANIASIYINHIGRGYAIISTYSESEFVLESIMMPVVNDEDFFVTYRLSTRNIDIPTKLEVRIKYGDFDVTESVIVAPNESKINSVLVPREYVKNEQIKVEVNAVNGEFSDRNPDDNVLFLNPHTEPNQVHNVELGGNQNQIKIKLVSGYEKTHNELIRYFEDITINTDSPVEKIKAEWNDYGVEFAKFYSGGIFRYSATYEVSNNYPYSDIANDLVSGFIQNNCEIIDVYDCYKIDRIDLNKNDNHLFNENFDDIAGTITENNKQDPNQSKLYTKLSAKPGKYPMLIKLENIGRAKINLEIESYIKVEGPIFGSNKNSLFYYRNISRGNPMPNYESKIWKNKLEILEKESENVEKITITSDTKKRIKEWIEENYQKNINSDEIQ